MPRPERGILSHFFLLWWMQTCIVASYFWLWLRTKVLRQRLSPEARAEIHRRNARRFKATACRLKGANVKLGQIASMQAHLLPDVMIEELRSLRDGVTPTDSGKVMALIESELGKPVSELFASFEETPMATASMGQVHGATLKDGRAVVVKVLHPGLERTVEIDLALMRLLLGTFRLFVPGKLDPMVILRETEPSLRLELDLSHEGKATDTLAAELRPLGVIVPEVHWAYTSRRVLTLDFIEGVNVDDRAQMDAWNVDREQLMRLYLQSFVQQALRGGYFHADPHPGNVFCTRDGNLALLDFGMVQRLPDDVRIGLMKEILGGFFARPRLWADGMIQKGAVGESDRQKLEDFAATAFLDPKARAMIFDHQVDSRGDLGDVVGKFAAFFKSLDTLQTPRDNVMFGRALGIIIDVIKEVVPEKSPSDVAGPVMMPVLLEFVQQHPEYMDLLSDLPAMLAAHEPPASLPASSRRAVARARCDYARALHMSDDPRLGTIVGEGYELVELLSEGTMGRLYEAWHPASGRHVAVKILDTRGMKDETLARRLLREVKALAALAHPVTVRVLDHGTLPDGGVFMVMEHLSGVTLRAVIQREGSLRPERAIRVVVALCGALEEAHQVGIVHRNLKPENVYLLSAGTDAERPKLIDFAHAKLDQARLLVSRTGLTAENTVVGTPAFMAPEQTRGEEVSARTDVYALGVVLYEAVTGRLPWDAETPAHLIERTLRGEPIPLRERCPGQIFPPGLWEVLERAMAKAPEARYPSASALGAALSALVGEDAEAPSAPQGSSVALGIAVMVVVAILGGITLAIVLR